MDYIRYEKPLAVEHLVFQVNPDRLDEWLAAGGASLCRSARLGLGLAE